MAKGVEVIVSKKRLDYVQGKLGKFAGEPPVVTTEEEQPGVLYLFYKAVPNLGQFMQVLRQNCIEHYRIITE
ncbi:hypothetical protein HYT05_05015 [Candidatus Kaiserbacteria bacterium]|nr:hypothetical protein [Candidatus Kaiserbacteria bacterium]